MATLAFISLSFFSFRRRRRMLRRRKANVNSFLWLKLGLAWLFYIFYIILFYQNYHKVWLQKGKPHLHNAHQPQSHTFPLNTYFYCASFTFQPILHTFYAFFPSRFWKATALENFCFFHFPFPESSSSPAKHFLCISFHTRNYGLLELYFLLYCYATVKICME